MTEKQTPFRRLAQFLFEVGTLRRVPRIHRQTLLVDDVSDTIASHSFRVAHIGWHLAKLEGADPYKVVMMCLLHDLGEARSNDHNWVHKRYIKIFDDEIMKDQLGTLPSDELHDLAAEYAVRKTKEAVVAKDADVIDQILLLREYEWQGNKEAPLWLHDKEKGVRYAKVHDLKTKSARTLGKAIYRERPSSWWEGTWTKANR
jgi:putative hydrolase of HD superfamily